MFFWKTKPKGTMLLGFCCLYTSGGSIPEHALVQIYRASRRMKLEQIKVKRFDFDGGRAVVRTEFKTGSLGTIGGVIFKASVELDDGREMQVHFIITHNDPCEEDTGTIDLIPIKWPYLPTAPDPSHN